MSRVRFLWLALALGAVCARAGVSTRLGEVLVDNVPIGEEIALRELVNVPYQVRNTGHNPVRMLISVVGRDPGEFVKPGYEKMPDLSWVRVAETEFVLAPGQEAVTDVFISIPNDQKHLGKKYQAYIWARARSLEEEEGGILEAGVKSRLLIGVARTPLSRAQRAKLKQLKATLGFQVVPDKLELKGVPLGKKVDAKTALKKSFKLLNPNEQDLKFKARVIERRQSQIKLPEGWEDPPKDAGYLEPMPSELEVAGNSIEELRLSLDFPKQARLAGRKFMYIVEVELLGFDVPVSYQLRVFVETEK